MKFAIVLGSRNPDGQTARAANAVRQGLIGGGGEGESVYLPELTIERCRQCDERGWGICRSKARCVIDDDDFASVVEALRGTDAVVFATPVYYGSLSESMRAFTDRLRRICGHAADKAGMAGKPAIGVCVAGGGGGGAPSCTVSLERVLRTCGFDLVDMVPVRRQNLEMKLQVLQITGQWLATCPSS
jgi:multimeric flavodoxin WrbA